LIYIQHHPLEERGCLFRFDVQYKSKQGRMVVEGGEENLLKTPPLSDVPLGDKEEK
jgi:hypothetical protein